MMILEHYNMPKPYPTIEFQAQDASETDKPILVFKTKGAYKARGADVVGNPLSHSIIFAEIKCKTKLPEMRISFSDYFAASDFEKFNTIARQLICGKYVELPFQLFSLDKTILLSIEKHVKARRISLRVNFEFFPTGCSLDCLIKYGGPFYQDQTLSQAKVSITMDRAQFKPIAENLKKVLDMLKTERG